MQGQTAEQKNWRMRNLLTKVVQLSEIYQRVAQARRHPTYREQFERLDTRESARRPRQRPLSNADR